MRKILIHFEEKFSTRNVKINEYLVVTLAVAQNSSANDRNRFRLKDKVRENERTPSKSIDTPKKAFALPVINDVRFFDKDS